MAWLHSTGDELIEAPRGSTVTLYADIPGINNQVITVGIYEVDPLDPDDLVEWVQMAFVDGIGTATWTTVWMEDGFLGAGGNPEYKFVLLGVDSPELEVW